MLSINKNVGLLSLGKRSTQFYANALADNEMTPVLIDSINFDALNNCLPDQFPALEKMLLAGFSSQKLARVNQLIMPNITLHETYDRLIASNYQFHFNCIHPVTLTLNFLKKKTISKIVLFASAYSMHSSMLKKQFDQAGIEVIVPNPDDANTIDHVRQQVYRYKESQGMIDRFNALVAYYQNLAPVVIACTELSIVLNESLNAAHDMARLQIQTINKG